jgi:threonylcarbamoyladenosine tRNA methylthiotransferase MtaB
MRTFCIETLGCKVNQYESEQIAALLRDHGLEQVPPRQADLRIINTCSVTIQAASKSRQSVRKSLRLPVLGTIHPLSSTLPNTSAPDSPAGDSCTRRRPRVIVTGCWATSDPAEAAAMQGVDAVLTHHDDVAEQLGRLLSQWLSPESHGNDGWMKRAGIPGDNSSISKAHDPERVKQNPAVLSAERGAAGTTSLPLLNQHQDHQQRAFLKIQDGCDAHCTYCIIPRLRTTLWSKPIDDAVAEARRLVQAGHCEIVLTGIFLGAYGQPTALRRRQPTDTAEPLGRLVEALCTRVPRLRRLRLSSLEPGDLTPRLINVLRGHPQCVPHFHLPLQSGSDRILRRMNRQYTRQQFLEMVRQVREGFDRPAITTDIIVGFPGETDEEFERTMEVVEQVEFIHIHAFRFSPRPNTAAARWREQFVHGSVVHDRMQRLRRRAAEHSQHYRRTFTGEEVEVLVERRSPSSNLRHGRSERYFDVWFEDPDQTVGTGEPVRLRIDRVTPQRTFGKAQ